MKFVISYFYQVRNMPKNMIPVSTRIGDPKWYHNFTNDKTYVFKDKRGIWNGIRAEDLHMPTTYQGHCGQGCTEQSPQCSFLLDYREYLNTLDFQDILKRGAALGQMIQEEEQFTEEPIIALLVHEAPTNPCSERTVLIQWFKDNNYLLEEFIPLIDKK